MGHRFRTQLLTPIKEVTIETGQWVGLTLKQQEVSGNQSLHWLQSTRSFIHCDSDCSHDECLIFMIINKMSSDRRRRNTTGFRCSDGEIRCKPLTRVQTELKNICRANDRHMKRNVYTERRLRLNPYQLFATGLLNNPLCNKRTQSCMAADLMSDSDDYD